MRQRENEMAAARLAPEGAVALLGDYLRRSRRLAGLSQQRLADVSGVSQTMVSRAERGVAPSMAVERLVRMVQPLARFFPLGVCPHDHPCAWQPFKEVRHEMSVPAQFVERMLSVAGES